MSLDQREFDDARRVSGGRLCDHCDERYCSHRGPCSWCRRQRRAYRRSITLTLRAEEVRL